MSHRALGGPSPRLVVTTPSRLSGAVLVLPTGRSVLGRAPDSPLWLDDPRVSRTHAALQRDAAGTTVEDLGSSAGTLVNGVLVAGAQRLRHGDMVCFGTVEARFEELAQAGAPTMVGMIQPVRAAALVPRAAPVRFDLGPQHAGTINNVGGHQYNQIVQRRESFLRQIAAAKTRARRLVQFGLFVFVIGLAVAVVGFLRYGGSGIDVFDTSGRPRSPSALDIKPAVEAFGVYMFGVVLAGSGLLTMAIGLVMHIVAAARGRRLDDPVQPSW